MFGLFTKFKIISLDNLIGTIIAGLVFFTPTNWFIKLFENQAYIHGLFSDYLLVKIYPTDLLVLALLVALTIKLYSETAWFNLVKNHKLLISVYAGLSLVLILRPLLTQYPWIGALNAVRLILFSGLVILLKRWWIQLNPSQLTTVKLIIGFSALTTVIFQSSLGLFQFFWKKSLFGYRFLGEVELAHPVGIAHLNWFGRDLVLPYGTTTHPNVLAGSLVILLVVGWSLLANYQNRVVKSGLWLATLLGILTLIITASLSGILAGLLATSGFIYLQLKRTKKLPPIKSQSFIIGWVLVIVVIPIILAIFAGLYATNYSISRRNALNQSALHMIARQPVLGTGMGLFTANLDQFLPRFEPVVFLQPVHHVPLLLVAQTGILGLGWLWSFWWLLKKSDQSFDHKPTNILPIPKLIIGLMVLPLFTLDHYLISLQTGLTLSVLILFLGRWRRS